MLSSAPSDIFSDERDLVSFDPLGRSLLSLSSLSLSLFVPSPKHALPPLPPHTLFTEPDTRLEELEEIDTTRDLYL